MTFMYGLRHDPIKAYPREGLITGYVVNGYYVLYLEYSRQLGENELKEYGIDYLGVNDDCKIS